MSGIRSRGRRGTTGVPNGWWENDAVDTYELRVAGWLASHADAYLADHVTRNEIVRRTGISRTRVSKSLDTLERLGLVEITTLPGSGHDRLVITVDFDVWEKGTPHVLSDDDRGRPTSSEMDAPRPLDGRQASCTKENNRNPVENPTRVTPRDATEGGAEPLPGLRPDPVAVEEPGLSHERQVEVDFDEFWKAWPASRRIDREPAQQKFKIARRTVDAATIMSGLERWKPYWSARGDAQFIPHPTTWLNRKRWAADPPAPPRSKADQQWDLLRLAAEEARATEAAARAPPDTPGLS